MFHNFIVRQKTKFSYLKKKDLGFDKVIRANIGDCHATGQAPMTYIRQVNFNKFNNFLLEIHLVIQHKDNVALCLSRLVGK